MNTMPQVFDAEPIERADVGRADSRHAEPPRAGFSVSAPATARRVPAAHLKLVASQAATGSAAALPYDLSARRHLAGVPEPQAGQAGPSQADAARADAGVAGRAGARASLEPIVFALVLLVSVAALTIGLGGR